MLLALAVMAAPVFAQSGAPAHSGGEASLKIPDLAQVQLLGVNGRTLLFSGLAVCVLGLVFGLVIYTQLKNLPVHPSMREISELIYETCKTYLITQGKFILVLEAFIGVIMVVYFGALQHYDAARTPHAHRGRDNPWDQQHAAILHRVTLLAQDARERSEELVDLRRRIICVEERAELQVERARPSRHRCVLRDAEEIRLLVLGKGIVEFGGQFVGQLDTARKVLAPLPSGS